jgi:hypothetical protein
MEVSGQPKYRPLYALGNGPVIHWWGGKLSPRSSTDVLETRQISSSLRDLRSYADCTTTAYNTFLLNHDPQASHYLKLYTITEQTDLSGNSVDFYQGESHFESRATHRTQFMFFRTFPKCLHSKAVDKLKLGHDHFISHVVQVMNHTITLQYDTALQSAQLTSLQLYET